MNLAVAALTVLVMVATGLVLFRRLARCGLFGAQLPPESDVLLLGILPGLALVGAIATLLAILHLFQFWVVLGLAAGILAGLRSEAKAILVELRDGLLGGLARARQGNFFFLIAVIAGCAFFLIGLLLSVIPAANVDVWVFHIPLAQSFITNHGFVFPQLPQIPFYSSLPLQFELLFATAMLAVPNYVAANAVNLVIFFGFVLLVLSFARRARDIQFLILCLCFFSSHSFLPEAATPMIDLPRSCFSVAAYLFAYRYARDFRRLDLVLSALMAGSAVAAKYTELVTPLVILLTVAPLMAGKRQTWPDMGIAIAIFGAVAGYWYAKNAILYGNPIYPFLFGHPGLSDPWMAGYLEEMTRPFDPADRVYSTNLATLQGWRDFSTVLRTHLPALLPLGTVLAVGLVLPDRRRWILPLWCFVLFVFWYAVMFNAMRWVLSAVLLTIAAAFIVWTPVIDRIARNWNPHWPTRVLEAVALMLRRNSNPGLAFASAGLILALSLGLVGLKEGTGDFLLPLLPAGVNQDLAAAMIKPGGMEIYLEKGRPGYALYRYIGEHNLAHVLQPFDNGGAQYASAYNGGHPNDWVLPYTSLPDSPAQTDAFVARNGIRYFVDRQPIARLDVERLGSDNVVRAKAVIARLKTHARLIAHYDQGMSLYQLLPGETRP